MTSSDQKRSQVFQDLLIAAMKDAATERKMTQLKATITPEGRTIPQVVRIIVVPESMDMEWPGGLGGT